MKAHCCEAICPAEAVWSIWDGDLPDNNTHACDAHVGTMLTPGKQHVVRPVSWDLSQEAPA